MAYADLLTIQTLNVGDILTAACMTQVRNNGEWHIDPAACSVFNSAAQSVPNTTITAMAANSEFYDNASMHSNVTSNSRITITTTGRYLFFATCQFAADVDGVRQTSFRVNAAATYLGMQVPAVSATSSVVITAARAIPLTAGDYVETHVEHQAGAALNVTLLEFAATFLTR